MKGYIRVYRKIRENPIFNDMELFRLWIICLTEATHKERDQQVGKQVVHLMPGEFVTGRFDLETMYNQGLKRDQQKSPKTVWRWLETLKNNEYLTIKTTNKFSIVAVLNWSLYQYSDQDYDQQVTNKRPTSDQQVTTNNNVFNASISSKDQKQRTTTITESDDSEELGSYGRQAKELIEKHGKEAFNSAFQEALKAKNADIENVKTILERNVA